MLAPSFSVVLSAHAFKSDKLGKSWGYVRRRSLEQPSAAAAASRSPRSEFPVVEPVRPSGPVPALAQSSLCGPAGRFRHLLHSTGGPSLGTTST